MKIKDWLEEEKEKYQVAIPTYEQKLKEAIEKENPEGAQRAASALQKANWYVSEILPLIEKYMSKTKK